MTTLESVYHKIVTCLLIIFPSIIFFLRLFFVEQSLFMIPDFGQSDVLHFHLPLKSLLSESLKQGQFPLWSPYLANGFPILAEGQIGTFFLPNLLLFRFLPTMTAYNLNLFIAYLILSMGTYLLMRCLRFNAITSIFASWIFTFSGYFSVHLNHFDIIQTSSLLPWVYWSLLRLYRFPKLKNAILASFILSQQIMAGYLNSVFITLVGALLVGIWLLFIRQLYHRKIFLSQLKMICIALILTFLFSAIQLLPTIELWQVSTKKGGLDFNTVTAFPYPLKHLATFINPYFFGSPQDASYPPFSPDWGIFWENTAYIGILPLVFAICAVFYLQKKITKIGFFLLITSLLLVLGKNSPLYFIFSIPPFNFFRVPSKFLLLTAFSLTLLASVTIEKILNRAKTISNKLYLIGILIIIASFLFDEFNFSYNYPPTSSAKSWIEKPLVLLYLTNTKGRVASYGAWVQWNSVFLTQGWKKIDPYIYFKNNLAPNLNALYQLSTPALNMGGLIPNRIATVKAILDDQNMDEKKKVATLSALTTNFFAKSGVEYLTSAYTIESENLTKIGEVKETIKSDRKDSIKVYRLKQFLPRVYFSSDLVKVDTLEELLRKMKDPKDNLKTTYVEDDEIANFQGGKPTGEIKLISDKPTETVIKTQTDKPTLLVLTDTNYPGWYAYVNDKQEKIYTVNLTQRAVLIPKGESLVKFSFQSNSFNLGKILTVFTWITISVAVFLSCVTSPHKVSHKKKFSAYL